MLTVGSVFSGIGGFDLGFERVGMRVQWQIENDKFCNRVLATHWPDVKRYGDVREVRPEQLERVDIVCGGFPCQDLSVAGKRAGLGGERSGLFWDLVRLVSALRPSWLVFENVPGLLTSNEGRDFALVLGGITGMVPEVSSGGWKNQGIGAGLLGWHAVAWRILDSQWFGVAQRRRRVFLVGHTDAGRAGAVLFEPEGGAGHSAPVRETGTEAASSVAACLNSAGNEGGFRTEPGEHLVPYNIIDGAQEGPNHAYRTERTGALQHKGNSASGNEAGTIIAYTLRENERNTSQGPANLVAHALNAHGGSCGRIDGESETFVSATPDADRVREAPGLPRGLDGARYRGLGNAVTVQVAEWIGRRIVELPPAG